MINSGMMAMNALAAMTSARCEPSISLKRRRASTANDTPRLRSTCVLRLSRELLTLAARCRVVGFDVTGESLPRHGDAHALFGIDEVIVVVETKIDLDPGDLAREPAPVRGVVRGRRGAGFVSDVGRLIGGEDHRLGGAHAARSDRRAVVVDRDAAALRQATTVVCEFHSHLVLAGRDRTVGDDGELVDAEHVVDELG